MRQGQAHGRQPERGRRHHQLSASAARASPRPRSRPRATSLSSWRSPARAAATSSTRSSARPSCASGWWRAPRCPPRAAGALARGDGAGAGQSPVPGSGVTAPSSGQPQPSSEPPKNQEPRALKRGDPGSRRKQGCPAPRRRAPRRRPAPRRRRALGRLDALRHPGPRRRSPRGPAAEVDDPQRRRVGLAAFAMLPAPTTGAGPFVGHWKALKALTDAASGWSSTSAAGPRADRRRGPGPAEGVGRPRGAAERRRAGRRRGARRRGRCRLLLRLLSANSGARFLGDADGFGAVAVGLAAGLGAVTPEPGAGLWAGAPAAAPAPRRRTRGLRASRPRAGSAAAPGA